MTDMKKVLLSSLLLLVVSAGCEVSETYSTGDAREEGAQVNLRIELQCSPPSTRALFDDSDAELEDAIQDGVILEFNQDGELLEMVTFSDGDLPLLQVRRYQQTDIYIVANPTVDLTGISSKEEFLSTRSEYAYNSEGRLEMTGHVSGIFDTDATVSVAMQRTVAKITLDALVLKVSKQKINYTGAHHRQTFMEKTPATCGYDLSMAEDFLNAYNQNIGIGYYNSYPTVNKYSQGEYLICEYNYPKSIYCYPNDSEDGAKRNKVAVSYRLIYTVNAIDAATGEPIVLTRYDDNTVHMVLPQLRPNTKYELEKLTITGANNRTVYLSTRSGEEEESLTCCFKMTDMTSGEYLGVVEGEVEYEMQDS